LFVFSALPKEPSIALAILGISFVNWVGVKSSFNFFAQSFALIARELPIIAVVFSDKDYLFIFLYAFLEALFSLRFCLPDFA